MVEKQKMNYYMLNTNEDLFDFFKKGLLTHEELVGFCKGAIYKYSTRYGDKGQKNSDLDKLVTYSNALHDLEFDVSQSNNSNNNDNQNNASNPSNVVGDTSNVQNQQQNNDIAINKEH